jgi:hypothetical protein
MVLFSEMMILKSHVERLLRNDKVYLKKLSDLSKKIIAFLAILGLSAVMRIKKLFNNNVIIQLIAEQCQWPPIPYLWDDYCATNFIRTKVTFITFWKERDYVSQLLIKICYLFKRNENLW